MRLIGCVIALLTATVVQAAPKPNVVFILADDLGWADLGCYGSKYHRTPTLDAFAKEAARFAQAYAGVHVCSPTRAAIMTGKWPARLGVTDYLPGKPYQATQRSLPPKLPAQLPAEEKTLANFFKDAGYVTAHIGKWHLGGKGSLPTDRGFDINIAGDHRGQPPSYFAPYTGKKGEPLPGLENAPAGEYLTDRLTAEAEKFLDANRDKPFLLYMPHFAVHTPLQAKADQVAKYKKGTLGSQGNPVYAAMLESLDESVGRVLKRLEDLKIADRTIVVFTSDNGGLSAQANIDGPTSNAPLREGKGFLYEGGLRVPLIVRWPGVTTPGSVIDEPVCAIDFLPTLLEACEIKDDRKRDGVSLVKLLKGEPLGRDALYWHYPHYHFGNPGGAIRQGDWKMIEFYDTGRRELYDLKKDPRESSNQAEAKPEVVKELADKLDKWRKEVGAKTMKPNPDYTPAPPDKDGNIVLHARDADVHGINLRYEPAPHKVTLGYWTRVEDWASWEFTVTKPGTFTVEVLQGCGKGQGGSEVELSVGEQSLKFTVEDTGHFQNFKARDVGTLTFDKPGRYTLNLKPTKKAAAAVMDVRAVTLKPKN